MSTTNITSPTPRARRNWFKLLGLALGGLCVLLIALYFVATSAAFFKGVILPRAGKALNATITVGDASISPFSQVVLSDFKLQTTGSEPLVAAREIRLRYSLMDILKGNINVEEATVTAPTIVLVENADGTSNLDPLLKRETPEATPAKAAPVAAPSKPMQLDVKKVALSDATIRKVQLLKNGKRDVMELSKVNVTLEGLKNGQQAKCALEAALNLDKNAADGTGRGSLQGKLNGKFDLSLTANLKPSSIQGTARFEVSQAGGFLEQAATLAANLDCEVSPTEIKRLGLQFQKGGTALGECRVSGPFILERLDGRLRVEILNLDRQVLNLAGAASGLDFGPTTVNSTNVVELANAASSISAVGRLSVNKFQVTRAGKTTPPFDLQSDYDVKVDLAAGNALLRALNISGEQKNQIVLRGELDKPMLIPWRGGGNAIGDSVLSLTLTRLELADWKPFMPDLVRRGELAAKLQLNSQQGGNQLKFALEAALENLAVSFGTNEITQAGVTLRARGQATEFKNFALPELSLQLSRKNQPLVVASGAVTFDQPTTNADVQVEARLMVPQLVEALPLPDAKVTSGGAVVKAHLVQKQDAQTISGNVALTDFTGQMSGNTFRALGVNADFDVGMTAQQVDIRKVSGTLTGNSNPGGNFELSGTYGLATRATQMKLRLENFNQNGLRPFLEPMLTNQKLESVSLNGSATVQYATNAPSAAKGDLTITNLVVGGLVKSGTPKPLEARFQWDVSLDKQLVQLRQVLLNLTPTTRAANQLQLSGQVTLVPTNIYQGNLKLQADALDLTSYYDLFTGPAQGTPPAKASTSVSAPGNAPALETEPPARELPFRNFIFEAALKRVYLHEMEIADFLGTISLDRGRVALNPFQMSLNGAPVKTKVDLDLGVPGYKYNLSLSARGIPLAPLVNSFQPERKGQVGGTLNATAAIAGAGTTGANLQKNLAGDFDVASTNLNLQVVDIKNALLKTLVNVVGTIPSLVKNTDNAASLLLGTLTQKSSSTNSLLSDDLAKSPIDQIAARGNIGTGRVLIQQALVQSAAFQAQATGTVALATVLTNSTIQIPVSIHLGRELAQRLNMVPANTPTNATYVKLPDFLTMKGTVGKPETGINKLGLIALAAQAASGNVSGQAGGILQGVSSMLQGGSSSSTNAGTSGTNPVGTLLQGVRGLLQNPGTTTNTTPGATNPSGSKASGLLQGLGGLLTAPATTSNTASGTATNQAATNAAPVNDLLNGLLGPKKK